MKTLPIIVFCVAVGLTQVPSSHQIQWLISSKNWLKEKTAGAGNLVKSRSWLGRGDSLPPLPRAGANTRTMFTVNVEIKSFEHLKAFVEESRTKLPSQVIMVYFYSDQCEGCKTMVPPILAGLRPDLEGVTLLRVQRERCLECITAYNVDSFPRFDFIKGGIQVDSLVGLDYKTEKDIRDRLASQKDSVLTIAADVNNYRVLKAYIDESRVKLLNQVILIYFYSEKSLGCRTEVPKILAALQPDLEGVTFLRVNSDRCPECTSAFKVDSFPRFIFIKAGSEVDSLTGLDYKTGKDIRDRLSKHKHSETLVAPATVSLQSSPKVPVISPPPQEPGITQPPPQQSPKPPSEIIPVSLVSDQSSRKPWALIAGSVKSGTLQSLKNMPSVSSPTNQQQPEIPPRPTPILIEEPVGEPVPMSVSNEDQLTQEVARSGDGLVLIYFFKVPCPECDHVPGMMQSLASDMKGVKYIKADADNCMASSASCIAVGTFPCFVFKKGGNQMETIGGVKPGEIREALQKYK